MNENAKDSKLQRILNSISLLEALAIFTNKPSALSHISESKQITSNIKLSKLNILPHYFIVGDYHAFITNFLSELFIGKGFILIVWPEMRCLTHNQPEVVKNYLNLAQTLIEYHKINEKIDSINEQWDKMNQSNRSVKLDKIDS